MHPGGQITFCARFDDVVTGTSSLVTGQVVDCANGCYEVLAWLPDQTFPFIAECCASMTAPEFIVAFLGACLGTVASKE